MIVLIACEESQAVCIEFRKLGHEAYSCDVQECSGNHPEWHIMADVLTVLNGGWFTTQIGARVYIEKWDMLIAFPPCTHLCVSGARHFEQKRKDGRQQQGIDFFMAIANAPIEKIAIENPVGIMSTIWRKPNQIIHPYYFGDEAQKTTCLWLINLKPLMHSKEDDLFFNKTHTGKGRFYISPKGVKMPSWCSDPCGADGKKIAYNTEEIKKMRSKTFPGIAKAMAEQWGRVPIGE